MCFCEAEKRKKIKRNEASSHKIALDRYGHLVIK